MEPSKKQHHLPEVGDEEAYGREFYDPLCELAVIIKDVSRDKTIIPRNLAILAEAGYKIKYHGDESDYLNRLGGRRE